MLVVYAEGFIRDGKPNLKLFHQLHWLVSSSYIAMAYFGVFPTPLVLKGGFPGNSMSGKVCLKVSLRSTNHSEITNVLGIASSLIVAFIIFYFKLKSDRYIRGICPQKTMSCIRKYKRNVIGHNQNMIHAFTWPAFQLLDVSLVSVYTSFDLSSTTVFLIDTLIFGVIMEFLELYFTFTLISGEIACSQEVPRNIKFYRSGPRKLIPRRPPCIIEYDQHNNIQESHHSESLESDNWSIDAVSGSVQDTIMYGRCPTKAIWTHPENFVTEPQTDTPSNIKIHLYDNNSLIRVREAAYPK